MVAQQIVESNTSISAELSNVPKFYEGARIFITGGSGFLGNLLIQKLIRDCPDLSKIYLLIRSKKGKTSEQRYEEMFQDVVFDKMKSEQPNYKEKIELFIGDLEQPGLGLNESDRKTLSEEINIVFHVAATVRFDEKMKRAASINLRASKDMVLLAKTMTNLKVFVYVSTAYSHCGEYIGEHFYDTPISGDRLLQITDTLNDDELDILTPKLLGEWPNTYTYTKACAENIIRDYGKGLPIAVVRPSMIISTVSDPLVSWINNFYGPVGMSLSVGLGVVRCVQLPLDILSDLVPADYVINNIIVAASHVGNTFKAKETQENNIVFDELNSLNEIPTIFNCISSNEHPLTWGQFSKFMELSVRWQSIHAVWYFYHIFTSNIYLVRFLQFLLHHIPAHIMDLVLVCKGKKRKVVKLYDRIESFLETARYFSNREWHWGNYNNQALWKSMSSTDKIIFPFSMRQINWIEYFTIFGLGLRIYLLKDPLETLPKALARYKKLKYGHYTLVTIFWSICMYVLYKLAQILFSIY